MDPAYDEYSRGMTAYKADDPKTAAVQSERVLEIDPAHGTASVCLAILQREFGRVARWTGDCDTNLNLAGSSP